MIGKLSTCECIVDLDENNHTGTYISQCKEHFNLGFTANEVIAEHVALQMEKTPKLIKLKRWLKI